MILLKRSFNYFAVLAKFFIPVSFPHPHQIIFKISRGRLFKARRKYSYVWIFFL